MGAGGMTTSEDRTGPGLPEAWGVGGTRGARAWRQREPAAQVDYPASAEAGTISRGTFTATIRAGSAGGLRRQAGRTWVTSTAAKRHRAFSEWT